MSHLTETRWHGYETEDRSIEITVTSSLAFDDIATATLRIAGQPSVVLTPETAVGGYLLTADPVTLPAEAGVYRWQAEIEDVLGNEPVIVAAGTLDVARRVVEGAPESFLGTQLTFERSPLVPSPAEQNPAAAVSVGEVEQMIGEQASGFVRSMDPKTTLAAAVTNTTTEGSLTNADFSMPKVMHETVWRLTAGGLISNISGGSVVATFRLRNITDSLVLASAPVTLASDAIGNRPWMLDLCGEGNSFLVEGNLIVGDLVVGVGSTDTLKHVLAQTIGSVGTADPQDWRLSVQFSVAHSSISVYCYTARMTYALPGA